MTNRLPILFATGIMFLVCACKRHQFLTSKLKAEKISENCQNLKPSLRSESNIAGRRFEFERCLTPAFSEKDAVIERNSDTVVVKFPDAQGANVFKITLDIDSYPEYHFLTIDGETFLIAGSGN